MADDYNHSHEGTDGAGRRVQGQVPADLGRGESLQRTWLGAARVTS
jgi:hypothetical protein